MNRPLRFFISSLIPTFFLFSFVLTPVINAHPGRTDSSGGHTCRTNCESWGLEYGEYHYHDGSTTPSSASERNYSEPVYVTEKSEPEPEAASETETALGYDDESDIESSDDDGLPWLWILIGGTIIYVVGSSALESKSVATITRVSRQPSVGKRHIRLSCPKCSGALRLRSGRYGKFYGCSRYPQCRYTRKK